MEINLKPDELERIINEEAVRPKFLAHIIFPYRYNNPDSITRHDQEIFKELEKGNEIPYKPTLFTEEFALSLYTAKTGLPSEGMFGWKDKRAQGILIFNDRFYDKICSPKVDDSKLNAILQEAKKIFEDYSLPYMNGPADTLIASSVFPWHKHFMTRRNFKESIKKLKSLHNCPDNGIQLALSTIFSLRYGDSLSFGNPHGGARAVTIKKNGSLVPQPYGIDDIKYFISYGDAGFKKAKVLIHN